MTKLERAQYNKEYYEKNKDKIRERRSKDSPQLTLLDFSNHQESIKPRPKKKAKKTTSILEVALLSALVAALTFYLVGESAHFYAVNDKSGINPWFKAVMVEGVLLGLMFSSPKTWVSKLFVLFLSCSLFLYITWGFSSHIFNEKSSKVTSTEIQKELIADLKRQIKTNEGLIQRWHKKGWVGAVRRLNAKNMALQNRLSKEVEDLRLNGSLVAKAEVSTMWSLIAFRVLMQVSNLFFTSRLGGAVRKKGLVPN